MNRDFISIIIPTLNEEAVIGTLIEHIYLNVKEPEKIELLVVDGGSEDKTKEKVAPYQRVKWILASRGRASQQNAGVPVARGNILYFLHADSFPPKNFDEDIRNAINKGYMAGCFRLGFDSSHWMLAISAWFTRFSYRGFRGGDQSLFIKRSLFKSLGGFNEHFKVCEDIHLIRKIYQTTPFFVIPKIIRTSARKYNEHGYLKLQYHFGIIHLMYNLGFSPKSLFQYYLRNIGKSSKSAKHPY